MDIVIVGFVAIALLGIFVGLFSGMLGIGGNIIAIPALLYIFKTLLHFPVAIAMHMVLATCLVIMVFTALSSTTAHYKNSNVDWSIYKRLAPFMILGTIAGAFCASLVHGIILEKIFGGFLFLIALQMFFYPENEKHIGQIRNVPHIIYVLVGILIGFKSGLLGIGGGAILIPFLLYLNYPARTVIGTTALCSFTVAVIGAITFFITGSQYHLQIPYILGFIYVPALLIMAPLTFICAKIGAHLSSKIPHIYLKRALNLLVAILSIAMLV